MEDGPLFPALGFLPSVDRSRVCPPQTWRRDGSTKQKLHARVPLACVLPGLVGGDFHSLIHSLLLAGLLCFYILA